MRVFIIDEELPYPLNTGKRIRTYNLIVRLARQHSIEFLCYRNSLAEEFDVARRHFASLGISCRAVARKLPTQSILSKGPAFYGGLALNLTSPLPYLVDKQRSHAMTCAVEQIDREESFDLWHCEWTPYAQFFRSGVSHPLVVSAHNVESLIWQRYFEHELNPVKRWYIGKQWKKIQQFEKWAFDCATRTVAVSHDDAELAKRHFASRAIDVVENGVDVDTFQSAGGSRIKGRLLFVGSLDWRPNVDGVIQFLDIAFPAIVSREPSVEFQIVGRNPPSWLVRRIEGMENVRLHANVEDVRPFFDEADVMVVPLRIGGGSRLKILEAAAMKLPIVSTRVGAEGLRLVAGKHYLEAESIGDMVNPVLTALGSLDARNAMTAAALAQVRALYDWDILACKLARVWSHAVESSQCTKGASRGLCLDDAVVRTPQLLS